MTVIARAALVEHQHGPFTLGEVSLDDPREDEVLVRIVAVGVCHTDNNMRHGMFPMTYPAVLGHEGAGIVEAIGSRVRRVAVGDHVVLGYASCGHCSSCLRGKPSYCVDYYAHNFGGSRTDGSTALRVAGQPAYGHFFGQSSFASHAIAYERNVVPVPKDVPLEILGPLGCGVQTGAGAVLRSLAVEAGSSIAVFGTGAVGLSAVMAARIAGAATIIGIDLDPRRLELATELGATHTIIGDAPDLLDQIRDHTGGGANYTVETTGVPQVLARAVDVLAVTGVCGLIGGSPLGTTAPIDMNNVLFGRTLRGICEGDSVQELFIPQLIEHYRQGRFPFDRLIRTFPFEKIEDACTAAVDGAVIKPVLTVSS